MCHPAYKKDADVLCTHQLLFSFINTRKLLPSFLGDRSRLILGLSCFSTFPFLSLPILLLLIDIVPEVLFCLFYQVFFLISNGETTIVIYTTVTGAYLCTCTGLASHLPFSTPTTSTGTSSCCCCCCLLLHFQL